MIQGDQDTVVPQDAVAKLVAKLSHQRGIKITYQIIPGATHFYTEHLEELGKLVDDYLTTAIPETAAKLRASR
jgi:alpha/beta superfamily hydrolase